MDAIAILFIGACAVWALDKIAWGVCDIAKTLHHIEELLCLKDRDR